jgi:hypothetical protein
MYEGKRIQPSEKERRIEVSYIKDGVIRSVNIHPSAGRETIRYGITNYVPFWRHAINLRVPAGDSTRAFAVLPCQCSGCGEEEEKMIATFIENDILRLKWVPLDQIGPSEYKFGHVVECAQCEYDQLGSVETSIITV